MKKLISCACLAIITVLLHSCRNHHAAADIKAEHTFSLNGSVREIKITPETPSFPDHEGKAEFVSYCSMCHSLRHIITQPDFPRTVWEAEVNKMVTKYMAPIDSATGEKIVSYIVAVKGKI